MKPIFIFNPEHDLALANGDRHYIPPKNIREMARDLSHLLEEALAPALRAESLSNATACRLYPWGWDYAVVERFKKMGVSPEELPSADALASLSARSERATAHHLLYAFLGEHSDDWYTGESVLLRHLPEISTYAQRYGHVLLKAPLSGSGKGLRHVNFDEKENVNECKIESWASALIRRHGYLTAEPFYEKVVDFAMEFCVNSSECQFVGYSLFNTDHHGRYIESRLMGDGAIEELFFQYIPIDVLGEVRRWIMNHWDSIVPAEWDTSRHPLYFGIDMMIVADDSQFKLHPCIEVNLRLNMGIIAHELYHHRLAPESRGVFRLAFFSNTVELRDFCAEQSSLHPAAYCDGRLMRGYLPLTPVGEETRHHAYILCE